MAFLQTSSSFQRLSTYQGHLEFLCGIRMLSLTLTYLFCLLYVISSVRSDAFNSSEVLLLPQNVTASEVTCDPKRVSFGLTEESCHNAWVKIARSVKPQIYAQRPIRNGEISLPLRYLSGTFPFYGVKLNLGWSDPFRQGPICLSWKGLADINR